MKVIVKKEELQLCNSLENYRNIDFEILNENGLSVQFYISAENFYELYVKYLYTVPKTVNSPLLPLNTVFCKEKENKITIVVKYPEFKSKFSYLEFEFPVIFPECVIFYDFKPDYEEKEAWALSKSRIFATKFENWTKFTNGQEDLVLYFYPYSNQSPSYGICLGNNFYTSLLFKNNNFYRLSTYYHYYMNSKFNSDLGFNISGYHPKDKNEVFDMFLDFFEVKDQKYEDYSYEEIEKQVNCFNYDKLISFKTIKTLKEEF